MPEGAPDWLAEVLADGRLPDGQRRLVQRIHQLVDQRDAERNLRIELERNAPPAQPPADPAGAGAEAAPVAQPAESVLQQLDRQTAELRSAIAWARANPDGGTLRNAQGQPVEVDAAGVAAYAAQWNEELTRTIVQRETQAMQVEAAAAEAHRQGVVRYQAAEAEARTAYPWLAQAASPEYAEARVVIRENPGITALPDWPLMVGDMVTRRMMRKKAGAAAPPIVAPPLTRPRAVAVPTPVVTTATPAAPRLSPSQQRIQEVEQRIADRGGSVTVKDRQELNRLRREAAQA